ncbi:3-hydroxyacyl-CoA dehydrogenase NAD-binding domain-containing protein [Bosea sp. CS1GBMeth4]|uniref:3-hydroxyacyl-CoA dehydrogenase NAD-binding domain-containing protein n=1 Tax=Bosea sp. CS1GBMeth4 TaxID=1892849 RepID=UPI001646BB58|nr:3-hydroxyacyl-CoA dehydrogenase NAD-binding domain-containing protein [Bosea sp. CS1GBMeth4]
MSPVRLSRAGDVGVIEIDNPPVNATSQAVRQGLLDAIRQARAEPGIEAIVIAGAGRTFTAGGDITEFGQPPREPHLPDVLAEIEASDRPVVAAWHGTALGGGCEIGLAAHARIIAQGGSVGLPEVKLGLVPGAGGTQRLPRLVGAVAALDLIATGRMVGADEALRLGLVGRIAAGDLREKAIAFAREHIRRRPSRVSLQPVQTPPASEWQAATDKVRREAKGRIAPLKAIELVEASIALPFDEGQPIERKAFFELMVSDQSRALRHLFLAEREASKLPELAGVAPREISRVGVIGGGTMGSGIAVAFLDAGYRVILLEANEAALAAGCERIGGLYQRSLSSGRISEAARDERLSRLETALDLAALSSCELVVEAVFEDMQVKLDLLQRLGATLPAETLIATNTSYLDIEAMADVLPAPERFLGLHFFSPAHVMKLLEIVRGRRTSPQALASAFAIGRKLRKIAVVSGVCEGFIGNRILAKFRAQCEFMLEEGALPRQVDAAMEAFGMAMGPFAVQDLAGLDIAFARRKRLAASRSAAQRDVPLIDRLCEKGRFGQKAGRGWYRYEDGKRSPDPDVEAMVRAHAAATDRPQKDFTQQEIQDRVVAAMVNEGAKILAEGIAARSSDIDLVLVNGYGFPAWRGGPMQHADTVGLPAVLAVAEATAARDGQGFELSSLLAELAGRGGRFSDRAI